VPVTYVDPGQSLVQALDPLLRKRGADSIPPACRPAIRPCACSESLAGRGIGRKIIWFWQPPARNRF
jgi:flagellar biosynthesis protein FlhF